MARRGKGSAGDDPNQLQLDWKKIGNESRPGEEPLWLPKRAGSIIAPALVLQLPWDFKSSFPQPTDEAIENGVLDEDDREPENLKSLHENYARQCLAILATLDKVLDARRRGVDPGTGGRPRTHAATERLRTFLTEEPSRLERTFDVLIGTYADGFGQEAADAFGKAVRAWHAGVAVVTEAPPDAGEQVVLSPKKRKSIPSSRMPVPKPLATAVAAGVFGRDENGKPIRPNAEEVRAITTEQAERMIEMKDDELHAAVTKYAEDFGTKGAAQLERYVRRQQRTR